MKGKRLLKNTALMTAANLFLQALGLGFQVLLSRRMGAAGLGLFGLVMSVQGFAATVAITGIRFATTRLTSEELGAGGSSVHGVVVRCLIYAAFFGLLAAALTVGLSDFVALRMIGDTRTAVPIRLLAISLPFVSLGAVFTGYFTGSDNLTKAAVTSVTEQLARMASSLALLSRVPDWDVEGMCRALILGNAAGEAVSFIAASALYALSRRGARKGTAKRGTAKRVIGTALPLGVSAWARTALNLLQNVLVPAGLRRSGATATEALAGYGLLRGMVFPVITFPQIIFSTLSELVVPELTEEQVRGRRDRISSSANALLSMCFVFSVGVMGALLAVGGELGAALYRRSDAGGYIRALAPLVPIMYMDSVTDGMLRGVGQHLYSMCLNVVDSILTTSFMWILLPRYGLIGYICLLYASELFNFTLSMARLRREADVRLNARHMLTALMSAVSSVLAARLLLGRADGLGALAVGLPLFIALYSLTVAALNGDRDALKKALAAIR